MQITRTAFQQQPPKAQPQPPKPPKPAPPKEDHRLQDTVETVLLTALGGGAGYFMGRNLALAMSPPMAPYLGVLSGIAGAASAYVIAVDMHSPIP